MTLKEQIEAMDAVLKDFWKRGGPQLAANGGTYQRRTTKTCPALEAEHRRLIQTWNEGRE